MRIICAKMTPMACHPWISICIRNVIYIGHFLSAALCAAVCGWVASYSKFNQRPHPKQTRRPAERTNVFVFAEPLLLDFRQSQHVNSSVFRFSFHRGMLAARWPVSVIEITPSFAGWLLSKVDGLEIPLMNFHLLKSWRIQWSPIILK